MVKDRRFIPIEHREPVEEESEFEIESEEDFHPKKKSLYVAS